MKKLFLLLIGLSFNRANATLSLNKNFTITEAKSWHTESLGKIFCESWEGNKAYWKTKNNDDSLINKLAADPKKRAASYRKLIKEKKRYILVGLHDGKVVGSVGVKKSAKKHLFIGKGLYLDKRYRRKGLGFQLLRELKKKITDCSVHNFFYVSPSSEKKKVKVVAWCIKNNLPARKLYEKMGAKLLSEKEIKELSLEKSAQAYKHPKKPEHVTYLFT